LFHRKYCADSIWPTRIYSGVTLGELAHALTTTTTACSDFSTVTDCDESQYFFLSSGDHRGNRARLSTVPDWIRGIFNIATNVDISAWGQNRSAN
jgi:hypothetical protein